MTDRRFELTKSPSQKGVYRLFHEGTLYLVEKLGPPRKTTNFAWTYYRSLTSDNRIFETCAYLVDNPEPRIHRIYTTEVK